MSSVLGDRVLAEALCLDHHRLIPGTDAIGVETALLVQLDEAVVSSTGRGSARGVQGSRAPLDLQAMTLRSKIDARVDRGLNEIGHGFSRAALFSRALVWLAEVSPEDYLGLEPMLAEWVAGIRGLVDPPRLVPLRGVHCSDCGFAQVLLPDATGVEVQAPAVLVTVGPPLTARCRVCGVDYDERGLHSLGDGVS